MQIPHLTLPLRPHWTEKRELFSSLTIQAIGMSMVQIFLPIYVLQLGYSFTQMSFIFFAQNFLRIPLHLVAMKSIKLFGVKPSLSIGYLLSIAGFVVVSMGQYDLALLLSGLALLALAESFYWDPRIVMSTQVLNRRSIGRNVGAIIILVSLSSALGPLIGGLIGERFGVDATLLVAAAVIFAACLPLLITKGVRLPKKALQRNRYRRIPRRHYIAGAIYNIDGKVASFLWPVFIYMIVGNLSSVGLLFAVTLAMSILITRQAGRWADNGKQSALIAAGSLGTGIAHAAKILVVSLSSAYAATLAYNVISSFKHAPFTAAIYKNARDYGIYEYVKHIQAAALTGNTIVWAAAALLSLLVDPKMTMIIIFVAAALLSPLQAMINLPLKGRR